VTKALDDDEREVVLVRGIHRLDDVVGEEGENVAGFLYLRHRD
jgi:hypothetical protein